VAGLKDKAEAAAIALDAVGALVEPPAPAQEVAKTEGPKRQTKTKPKPQAKPQTRPQQSGVAERRALSGQVLTRRRQPIEIVLGAMWAAEERGDVDKAVQLAACALPYTSPRLQAVQVRQANSLEDMPLDQLQAFVRAGQMALKDPDYLAAMQRHTKLDAEETQAPMTVEAAVTDVAAAVVLDGAPEAAEVDSQS
jgi:hypothetical protein